jgi:hypothetical protein
MTTEELAEALAASPSPDRVTPEYFRSRIAKTEFHRIAGGTLTICVLTIDNGFQVTGQSACADPANYRQDIGEKIALDNAERALWPLLGFLVCEGIYRRKLNPTPPTIADGFARYVSHKVVEAGPIAAAEFAADRSGRVALKSGEIVQVPPDFYRSGKAPEEGDMLVRYSDGYLSWSPRQAFLDGYRNG